MQQLSYLDASFLHIESGDAPMHVSATYVLKNPKNQAMTFKRFKNFIQSRLQTSVVFRRKLIELPLDFDLPYWVEDLDFNIDNHLSSCTLKNGSLAELNRRAETFFSQSLDKKKPLWELLYIDSLQECGDFAFIVKVHHCAIDGISGQKILAGLMDISEQPRTLGRDIWQPETQPEYPRLLQKRIQQLPDTVQKSWVLVKSTAKKTANAVSSRVVEEEAAPPLFFNSPKTAINTAISQNRRFTYFDIPLNKVKEIKNTQQGLTVNDVVLTICSSALEQFLATHPTSKDNISTDKNQSLTAMAPISLRKLGKESPSNGNEISAMMLSLETQEKDPVKKLTLIHNNSRKGMEYNKRVSMERLLRLLPPMSSAISTKLFTAVGAIRLLKPIFNVAITNVPGSPVTLYLDGAEVLKQAFNIPVYNNAGLNFAVTSYKNTLSICVTSTPEILPKADMLVQAISTSFDQLYQAACTKGLAQVG